MSPDPFELFAPWLLTDVPLGLGSAEKWSRDFRAVLDLPITMQNVGYVQFTTNPDRLPSSEWASPPPRNLQLHLS